MKPVVNLYRTNKYLYDLPGSVEKSLLSLAEEASERGVASGGTTDAARDGVPFTGEPCPLCPRCPQCSLLCLPRPLLLLVRQPLSSLLLDYKYILR